ncbi:hypothetical protein KP509_29G056100 [Ceratopteris richardii]|uniref:TFIIS N-terminal domain-containing protein n=1 Tax=Ceratopteris richardii TaxID=49495 RepID=A0A8T2R8I4_CERRI|nr:hypothetical protein KP509_29G056100 [Ceratopteris richardii]
MEQWRVYLESSGVDFWTICERALALAYIDNPIDFPVRRDRLAQKLFAPEKLEQDVREDQAPLITGIREGQRISNRKKTNSSSNGVDPAFRLARNDNYDEAEALTEEMEEETLLKRDVFEIKDVLVDSYKSEREILISLQRLEYMQLSFDVLKETEIGKTVNSLRKHPCASIRSLVKKLVSEWKDTANHWYKSMEHVTAAARAEHISDHSTPDGQEDGLPSPPMDEGALLAGRTVSIEMSQLFDFMDDDTSPQKRGKLDDMAGSTHTRKASGDSGNTHQSSKQSNREDCVLKKKESALRKREMDNIGASNGHGKKDQDNCLSNGSDIRRHVTEKVERRYQEDTQESPELDERLLAAKRKLQENYQQAEIVKRQRTIQVMELEQLPKGGPKRAKAPQMVRGKPLSHHRPQSLGH